MSATGRGAVRVPQDVYMTPASAVEPLEELIRGDASRLQGLEPCRGSSRGAAFLALRRLCAAVEWCEIREGRDYLATVHPRRAFDLVITNPPYADADAFIRKTLHEADTVIHLLRLNFLGAVGRRAFWQANRPSHVLVLSERPVFVWTCKGVGPRGVGCGASYAPGREAPCERCGGRVKPGTDATEYAWFAWDRAGLLRAPAGVSVL